MPLDPPSLAAPALTSRPTLAGAYTLTLAANGCGPAFPSAFRTRTFAVRLDQDNARIEVILSGPTLGPGAKTAGYDESYVQSLRGQIMPDGQVTLTNYEGNEQWSFIAEQATPSDLLTILVDEARLTVSPNGLSGRFVGGFLLYPNTTQERICQGGDHGVDLSLKGLAR